MLNRPGLLRFLYSCREHVAHLTGKSVDENQEWADANYDAGKAVYDAAVAADTSGDGQLAGEAGLVAVQAWATAQP